MVATGLPLLPASPAGAVTTAEAAPALTPADEFLGTLLKLLAAPEPAPAVPDVLPASVTADAVENAPLEGAVDPASLMPMVLAMPLMQVADIRAAQLLARSADTQALGALNTLTAAIEAELSAGPLPDADPGTLLALLKDPLPEGSRAGIEPAAGSAQPPALSPVAEPAPPARNAESIVPRQLSAPVGTPAWANELGTQLHIMADKGQTLASLRLSPEHLGPLDIQIAVQDDQATVWFGAANADTRAALEQAMPRLRELLAAQGLSLLESGVFSQTPENAARHAAGLARAETASPHEEIPASAVPVSRRGLIDAYA